VANGEIYNFPRVRPALDDKHTFRTTSDTEAILHLYEEHGTEAVGYLDGMYAFALVDEEKMFLARDPIGIKPLYYAEGDGELVFASELKALAGRFRDVHEFPPGSFFHSDWGFVRHYSVPDVPVEEGSVESWRERIRESMERCVEKQNMSDMPVGAFLSGGLDSSILAALLRRQKDELHTFAVGLEGSGDLAAARMVAEHLDTIHHEYVITAEDIAQELPGIVHSLESFDQDLVRSAVPTFFTARMAAEHVTVILTGEGADELFAGYSYHKDIPTEKKLRAELRRSVASLHNLNLQRVDRMTMAHSIEGRPPFLDPDVIDMAQRVPARLKLSGKDGQEKWILRKAFEDLLPEEIVWRKKEQFDEGSGIVDVAAEIGSEGMSEEQADRHRERYPDTRLRSTEECYYHHLLVKAFEDPDPVLANVGRWTDRPADLLTA
jgi:asparagine synthase (glutamine-hydrolysing)